CRKLPHAQFVHHSSLESKTRLFSPSERLDMYISWAINYVYNFGPFEEAALEYWPFVKMLMTVAQWDLATLNQFAIKVADVFSAAFDQSRRTQEKVPPP